MCHIISAESNVWQFAHQSSNKNYVRLTGVWRRQRCPHASWQTNEVRSTWWTQKLYGRVLFSSPKRRLPSATLKSQPCVRCLYWPGGQMWSVSWIRQYIMFVCCFFMNVSILNSYKRRNNRIVHWARTFLYFFLTKTELFFLMLPKMTKNTFGNDTQNQKSTLERKIQQTQQTVQQTLTTSNNAFLTSEK